MSSLGSSSYESGPSLSHFGKPHFTLIRVTLSRSSLFWHSRKQACNGMVAYSQKSLVAFGRRLKQSAALDFGSIWKFCRGSGTSSQ
ncbi:hypothetical protein KFK09_023605 [Dendrobium nobile]|uniref:Uncharacterized protein n=1 Tax=Dendrobium nobile TaxID=94219 RepID=A0A8T3AAN9_DENNO|nr:hypothetical protein KFK09_023605 [Dendrobium nobile]